MTPLAAQVMRNEALRQKKTSPCGKRVISDAIIAAIRASDEGVKVLEQRYKISRQYIWQVRAGNVRLPKMEVRCCRCKKIKHVMCFSPAKLKEKRCRECCAAERRAIRAKYGSTLGMVRL